MTPRQLEVLTLRATGRLQKEVAADLGVSEETIKRLSHEAYDRLGVFGLVEAMNSLGWVRIEEKSK